MRLLSSLLAVWITIGSSAQAHEVLPSITDMTQDDAQLVFDMRLNIESFIAGIDQTSVADTDEAEQAADYDALHALDSAALSDAFRTFWPTFAENTVVETDAGRATLTLTDVQVPEARSEDTPRTSTIQFTAALPEGATNVQINWAREFGTLVIRQMGVDAPYDGYLEAGATSDPISLSGGDQASGWQTFLRYIPVGFDHIVPKGLDHILFVLGLFFLSTRMHTLLWQVSAFTLAHTITLALAASGVVTIPGSIVEPLIALSIVYVAVENLFTDGLSRWRPYIIFGFGLLHGLGFASVLAEFGLPAGSFIPALIGFNIGVEIGQIAVIAVAFICVFKAIEYSETAKENKALAGVLLVGMVVAMLALIPLSNLPADLYESLVPLLAMIAILLGFSAASIAAARFDSYRDVVAMPGSILIAVVAAYWCVERVFL